ncbi:MAG: hypothetical protein EAZ65_06395 [Verrucomicrobia bacterium]|nr:MAG: hypothetical protein EAZ84_12370 [Verrucomicrobiota bacterium]TAE87651.1 MAG: hypothetical protein EAZ82_06740 [Verrucomicrobiota bacterium]TAF25414.1 MAG: hypothetical protein EAZ71_08005 [Verrucomicrobiota bacterium]TAF41201.1 MAG: hypothetical protein EAZ65_06395 [Verrucomicrobiota bacterium]
METKIRNDRFTVCRSQISLISKTLAASKHLNSTDFSKPPAHPPIQGSPPFAQSYPQSPLDCGKPLQLSRSQPANPARTPPLPKPASPSQQSQSTCKSSEPWHSSAMRRLATVFLLLGSSLLAAAEPTPTHPATPLKVASLHPLIGDLARQVGGDRVEVIDLIGKNADPHHFEPVAADLQRAAGAKLYLASGMGLESYLKSLRGIVGDKAEIVEIGRDLPSIEGACEHEGHDHGEHEHGIDPHWWHSIDLFRRATTITAETFARADPSATEVYAANAAAYRAKLDELERWTRKEISRIPRERRHLATAHAAFGYFCKDHGFEPFPVQGINREQMPDPKKLARLIAQLKEHEVGAIFPEKESNPKILQALTKDSGIALGKPLIADGSTAESYEAMIRHNVGAIVAGLAK